jgi:hypothetical protein
MYFSHFDAETTIGLVREAGFEILDAHRAVQLEGRKEVEFLWVLAAQPPSPLAEPPLAEGGGGLG